MLEVKKIKEMPEEDRPYEKVRNFGTQSLTDLELLAVLIRSGTKGTSALELANTILCTVGGDRDLLNIHRLSFEQLMQIKGIGEVKAIQIMCLSELVKRLSKAGAKEWLTFQNPETIARYYMEDMRHQKQEQMKILMLDTKSHLIKASDISKGTVNSAIVSPREIFVEALHANAVFIILLHNHPSGDPSPSESDIKLTNRVKSAGKLVGIDLLDHIIIGNNCYISFAESNLI